MQSPQLLLTLGAALLALLLLVRVLRDRLRIELLQSRGAMEREQSSQQQQRLTELEGDHLQLQRDCAELRARLEEREKLYSSQLSLLRDSREQLGQEFENLANRIFDEKGRRWGDASKQSLEDLLTPFREQIGSFRQRVDEVHTESVKGQSTLEAELRKVLEVGLEMNNQASQLSTALRGDNKAAGNWGEVQLERTLELAGLRPDEHYQTQASFRDEDGRLRYPDAVLKLPTSKHIVIDSKVSLADYQRAVEAEGEGEQQGWLDAHAKAVQRHIDELAAKDYAALPGIGSPDFVLMFMPVEAAYIAVMKHRPELFNQGYRKGVVLVSHTTLMPVLRTVANLWMVEQSSREAREISDKAGDLYNQVCLIAERLQRLGNTLKAAGNHYNDAVRGLTGKQGLHGKVERFQLISSRARRDMPALEPVHNELELERLRMALAEKGETTAAAPATDTDTDKPTGADSGNCDGLDSPAER